MVTTERRKHDERCTGPECPHCAREIGKERALLDRPVDCLFDDDGRVDPIGEDCCRDPWNCDCAGARLARRRLRAVNRT